MMDHTHIKIELIFSGRHVLFYRRPTVFVFCHKFTIRICSWVIKKTIMHYAHLQWYINNIAKHVRIQFCKKRIEKAPFLLTVQGLSLYKPTVPLRTLASTLVFVFSSSALLTSTVVWLTDVTRVEWICTSTIHSYGWQYYVNLCNFNRTCQRWKIDDWWGSVDSTSNLEPLSGSYCLWT